MLYLIGSIFLMVIIYTIVKYKTLSLRLFLNSLNSFIGGLVGSIPTIFLTIKRFIKLSNKKSSLKISKDNKEEPKGFNYNRKKYKKLTQDKLYNFNQSMKVSYYQSKREDELDILNKYSK